MVFRVIEKQLETRISLKTRMRLQSMLDFAGESEKAEHWLARNMTLALSVAIGLSLAPLLLQDILATSPFIGPEYLPYLPYSPALIFAAVTLLFTLFAYFSIYFRIEARRKRTFDVLPDFLTAVSMNLHAGMEPMSALYVSLRSDFEPITSEMRKIRSLALGSRSIFDQLSLLQKTIDSQPLKRTLGIVGRSLRSGGDLGRLLMSVSDDLREMSKLQKELETATRTYAFFIGFLVLLGVPLLLGAVSVLIEFASKQVVSAQPSEFTSSLGLFGGQIFQADQQGQSGLKPVNSDIIFILLIAVSTISASMMFGVLWQGEVRSGVRYVPLMLPAGIVVFFVVRSLISGALGILFLV